MKHVFTLGSARPIPSHPIILKGPPLPLTDTDKPCPTPLPLNPSPPPPPALPCSRTDNRWTGKEITDDPEEEKKQKAFKGLLNKLTVDNAERVVPQVGGGGSMRRVACSVVVGGHISPGLLFIDVVW